MKGRCNAALFASRRRLGTLPTLDYCRQQIPFHRNAPPHDAPVSRKQPVAQHSKVVCSFGWLPLLSRPPDKSLRAHYIVNIGSFFSHRLPPSTPFPDSISVRPLHSSTTSLSRGQAIAVRLREGHPITTRACGQYIQGPTDEYRSLHESRRQQRVSVF